jgi:myotubularin-related protein 6/7/8
LKNNRSNQDERLIEAIFTSHTSPETAYGPPPSEYGAGFGSGNPLIASSSSASMQAISTSSSAQTVYGATATNLIVDARPTANAMANVATGAGTENMEYYKLARKTYLGIENIHVMRDSLKKIETALQKAENTGMMDRHLLRRSNWLKHISAILDGALIIVRNVHINSSHVLIHCSDGWDRTSQLSALAQVCLDPYFRTIKGFQVLIEKDWISFGHKFMDRCGHLSPDKLDSNSASKAEEEDEERNEATKAAQAIFGAFQKQFTPSSHHVKETSPVFHQFLDCVQQLQRQFPERFEYNSKFLEDLYYHLYSCQFGTFISNTERQRRTRGGIDDDGASLITASKPPLCERTVSIWNHFNLPSQLKKYTNSRYDTSLDDRTLNSTDGDMGVLLPNAKDVRFWSELFKRGDEEMNGAKQLIFDQAQGVEVFGPISTSAGDPVVERDPATARQANAILDSFADATNPIGGPRSPGRSSSPLPRSASPAYKASGDSWHNVEASSIPGPVARKKVETTSLGYGYPASQSPNRAKSGGGSWGWSNFSSGALSALQGAAKEIRTIGADAYTNLGGPASDRSTGDASTAWDRPASSSVRTADYPTSGGWSNNYSAPPKARVVSDANPWASSSLNESSLANDTIHKETQGLSQAARVPAPPIHSDNSYLKTPSETWGSVADRKHRGATPQDNRAVADLSDGINGLAVNTPTRSVDPVSNSNSNGKPSSWDPLGAM